MLVFPLTKSFNLQDVAKMKTAGRANTATSNRGGVRKLVAEFQSQTAQSALSLESKMTT